MIIIFLMVIIVILLIFLNSKIENKIINDIIALIGAIVILFGIIAGVFLPTDFKEPVFIAEKDLATLTNATNPVYLSVDGNKYTFCELPSNLKKTVFSNFTSEIEKVIGTGKEAKVKIYRQNAKMTWFSFGFLFYKTNYIFIVPEGTTNEE